MADLFHQTDPMQSFSAAAGHLQKKRQMDLQDQAIVDRKVEAVLAPLGELRSKYYNLPAGPTGDADRQRIVGMFEQYAQGVAQPNIAKLFNASSTPNPEIARRISSVYNFGAPEDRKNIDQSINDAHFAAQLEQAEKTGQARAAGKVAEASELSRAISLEPELAPMLGPKTKEGKQTSFTPAQKSMETIGGIQNINAVINKIQGTKGLAATMAGKKLSDSYVNKYAEMNPDLFNMQVTVVDDLLGQLAAGKTQADIEKLQVKIANILRTGEFQGSPFYSALQQLTELRDPIGFRNEYKKFIKQIKE